MPRSSSISSMRQFYFSVSRRGLQMDRRQFFVISGASILAGNLAHEVTAQEQVRQGPLLRGMLNAWFDINPEDQENFFEWHNREHMPERLGITGFTMGRRFRSTEVPNYFLIIYDVDKLSTLESE